MASTSQATICDLPNEVLLSIFSFLPVTDLAWCAATCQQWNELVTSFTHLWKGKSYSTTTSPAESVETCAVLHALPAFKDITIDTSISIMDTSNYFSLSITYPSLNLSMKYVSSMEDYPTLRCECLSTRLDIAGDIIFHWAIIDFDKLQHLRIIETSVITVWVRRDYTADNVVRKSLAVFPSLRHLGVSAEFLDLDVLEGLSRLQTLEIVCPGLENLSFLRHCSAGLEELTLMGCSGLPSRELSQLPQLRRLRMLRLSHHCFEEHDLAAAVAGLGGLEVLQLHWCSFVGDLSVLQRCRRLRELCITHSLFLDIMEVPTQRGPRLYDHRPPSALGVPPPHADGITVSAGCLSDALSQLGELGVNPRCLAYLGALCSCPQLRHICCEIPLVPKNTQKLHMCVHITFTISA